jgi:hypothetical protein
VTGRQNNQGLEGLTASPDGKILYALVQSALRQDGGDGSSSARFYTRFLAYDATRSPPRLKAEYVVKLPLDGTNRTAAQSEVHFISDTQFLVLARDSGNGFGNGASNTRSTYRSADVFDISEATDIAGRYDDAAGSVVVSGFTGTTATLKPGIVAAEYCRFVDFNVNSQLGRFGLHNGGAEDAGLLNEKWEGLALVPVEDGDDDEYFLFATSDNDFRAVDGK